jgi:hypothetical protein
MNAIKDCLLARAQKFDPVPHAVRGVVKERPLGEWGVRAKRDEPFRCSARAQEHRAPAIEARADKLLRCARHLFVQDVDVETGMVSQPA